MTGEFYEPFALEVPFKIYVEVVEPYALNPSELFVDVKDRVASSMPATVTITSFSQEVTFTLDLYVERFGDLAYGLEDYTLETIAGGPHQDLYDRVFLY